MSIPEYDILKCDEAMRILGYVTHSFYNNSRIGLWLFEVIARELNDMRDLADDVSTQSLPQTASWTLDYWENAYGLEKDDSLTEQTRRKRLLDKIIERAPINPERIRRSAERVSGLSAEVFEHVAPFTFRVELDDGVDCINYGAVHRHLTRIKPSHMSMEMKVKNRVGTNLYVASANTNYYSRVHRCLESVISCVAIDVRLGVSLKGYTRYHI